MRRLEYFENEGINPFFVIVAAGLGVVLFGALVMIMCTMPYGNARSESSAVRALPEEAANLHDDGEIEVVGGIEEIDGEEAEEQPPAKDFPNKAAEPIKMTFEQWKKETEKGWEELLAEFESEGITVDLAKKRVSVKGAIIRDKESRRYPIEYVVVTEGGNTHEAMILIRATPSNLNAALLAIGLEAGNTVIYRKKNPPPPQEEVDAGMTSPYEVIPPKGTVMKIYVTYEGWEENKHRLLEDLILNLRTRETLERVGWVYVGSRFAKVLLGRERVLQYMADMERNIVALYLTGYGNTIFDVNTLEGVDDSVFDVNPETAPPMGAPVTLTFTLDGMD